jgi:hypothetical protein
MCNKALQMTHKSSNTPLHLPFWGVTPLVNIQKHTLLSNKTPLQVLHFVTDSYRCYTCPLVTITNTDKVIPLRLVTGVTPCYTLLQMLQMLHPRILILILNKILFLSKMIITTSLMKINNTDIRNNLNRQGDFFGGI